MTGSSSSPNATSSDRKPEGSANSGESIPDYIKNTALWRDVMAEGESARRDYRTSVCVLLLCWATAEDIKEDVKRLESVFEKAFDADEGDVCTWYLEPKPGQWIQDVLSETLSKFVGWHEKTGTLIVYYNGHGQPGGSFDAGDLSESVSGLAI